MRLMGLMHYMFLILSLNQYFLLYLLNPCKHVINVCVYVSHKELYLVITQIIVLLLLLYLGIRAILISC